MIREFLTRQFLKHQLKNVPEEQRDQIIALVEKNPDLFKKIGTEIEEKKKQGMDEMMASLMVMKKYERELKTAAGR